jgi:hypothetical protein
VHAAKMIEENDVSQVNKPIVKFSSHSLIIGNASQQMAHCFLEVLFSLLNILNLLLEV